MLGIKGIGGGRPAHMVPDFTEHADEERNEQKKTIRNVRKKQRTQVDECYKQKTYLGEEPMKVVCELATEHHCSWCADHRMPSWGFASSLKVLHELRR